MSRDKLDEPPVELSNPDKHTNDTPTRMSHSTLNAFNPGGEVCIRSKGLCMGTEI